VNRGSSVFVFIAASIRSIDEISGAAQVFASGPRAEIEGRAIERDLFREQRSNHA